MRRFVSLIVASTLFGANLCAQTFTVHATDPAADFQSLETAIQTVASGSLLLVQSDFAENGGDIAYDIGKDLTLVGDKDDGTEVTVYGELWIGLAAGNPCHVKMTRVGWDSSFRPFPIGTVVQWALGSILHLDRCTLRTSPDYFIASRGAPLDGIQILTYVDAYGGEPSFAVIENTSDGTLILKGCTLTHNYGDSEDALWMEHGTAYYAETVFNGNLNVSPGGEAHAMFNLLTMDEDTLNIGDTLHITGKGTSGGMGLLFYSIAAPIHGAPAGSTFWLLGPPFFNTSISYDVFGSLDLSADLPDDPILIGVPLYMQSYDFGSGLLSCLDGGIIGS